MRDRPLRDSIDYNRALSLPVRLAHAGFAILRGPQARRWLTDGARAWWAVPAAAALVAAILLNPLDGPIAAWTRSLRSSPTWLGEPLRNLLELVQKWGGFASILAAAALIAWFDSKSRRRIADLLAAAVVTSGLVFVLKVLIGRPRPKFMDPGYFCTAFGEYPIHSPHEGIVTIAYPWEIWRPIGSDLWSMPSSHTAGAVVLSLCLARLYPRSTPIVAAMVFVVGFARVWLNAHYLTDTIVGAAVGLIVTRVVFDRGLGCRRLAARRNPRTPIRP